MGAAAHVVMSMRAVVAAIYVPRGHRGTLPGRCSARLLRGGAECGEHAHVCGMSGHQPCHQPPHHYISMWLCGGVRAIDSSDSILAKKKNPSAPMGALPGVPPSILFKRPTRAHRPTLYTPEVFIIQPREAFPGQGGDSHVGSSCRPALAYSTVRRCPVTELPSWLQASSFSTRCILVEYDVLETARLRASPRRTAFCLVIVSQRGSQDKAGRTKVSTSQKDPDFWRFKTHILPPVGLFDRVSSN